MHTARCSVETWLERQLCSTKDEVVVLAGDPLHTGLSLEQVPEARPQQVSTFRQKPQTQHHGFCFSLSFP